MITNYKFKKYFWFLEEFFPSKEEKKAILNNKELREKINKNESIIYYYIKELSYIIEVKELNEIIKETIINIDEDKMKKFLLTYIKSGVELKRDKNYVEMMISDYIDNSYEIRNINDIFDKKYEQLKTGLEEYKGISLDKLYKELKIKEKEYVIKLLEKDSFDYLNILFESTNYSLSYVINLLINNNIDEQIINSTIIEQLGVNETSAFIYMLCDIKQKKEIVKCTKYLIKKNKIDIIKENIENGTIKNIVKEYKKIKEKKL